MNARQLAATLHPLELRVLDALGDRSKFSEKELEVNEVNSAQLRTVIEWQLAKGCMKIADTREKKWIQVTEQGKAYCAGTPEQLLIRHIRKRGPLTLQDLTNIQGITSLEAGRALGILKKSSVLVPETSTHWNLAKKADIESFDAMGRLIARVARAQKIDLDTLSCEDVKRVQKASRKRGKERGIFRIIVEVTRILEMTELGFKVRNIALERSSWKNEVNVLTPKMLADRSWQDKNFRPYNLSIRPPRRVAGRRNAYREFLDYVRRKLVGLGFEEMTGEIVETEFWNMDALFMPQFHPAREIHDVYFVKDPSYAMSIEEPYSSQVGAVHQNGGNTGSKGWGYTFDHKRSRRLVLRSQGTALSARWLQRAKKPGKYFAIARCFRYDEIDSTHAPDFFQCEGIVLGEKINFINLLGLLQLFAREIAKTDNLRFVPAYFPFTEPSVEVHIKHPSIGWTELGGAGIFRPEVTLPQGVKVPVIAWGLGLDRMAMTAMHVNDIRDLFTCNLNKVREMRIRIKD